ncbi:response regulator transcription factor [Streptomyces sp. NPDC000888]
MTTVLIVNDQTLQRLGLRMFLEAQPDLTIVGEATAYAQAVRLADSLRPDVVLMDMGQPDGKHIQAIHRITRPYEDSMAPHADGTGRLPHGY